MLPFGILIDGERLISGHSENPKGSAFPFAPFAPFAPVPSRSRSPRSLDSCGLHISLVSH